MSWRYKLFNKFMSENGRTVHLMLSLEYNFKLCGNSISFNGILVKEITASTGMEIPISGSHYTKSRHVFLNTFDVFILSPMYNSVLKRLKKAKDQEALDSISWLREIVTKASVSPKEPK